MTGVKCRCDSNHKKRPPPRKGAAGKSGGLARRPEPDIDRVSQAAGSRARLGDDGLESTKGSRETDSRHSADRWGIFGVRFRRTERPSRYRLLDREVEAGHHPNDGRRRHQFPASNGLSRCSGQSRALNGNPQASLGSATVPYTRLSRFSRFASPPNFANSTRAKCPRPDSRIRPASAAEYDSQHPPRCPKSRPEAAYFHNVLFHRDRKRPGVAAGPRTLAEVGQPRVRPPRPEAEASATEVYMPAPEWQSVQE
jgi:hypothetical protein